MISSLLEDPLLDAFGYTQPPTWFRWCVEAGLRTRALVIRFLPRRKRPRLVTEERVRSYSAGHRIDELGVSVPDIPTSETGG